MGIGNLSRVYEAGDWLGVSSGVQGGSGQTPLLVELYGAVVISASQLWSVEI